MMLSNAFAGSKALEIQRQDMQRCKSVFPLSILCRSLRDIDTYTTGFPRGTNQGQANIFRAVKRVIPGPYTFILPATKELPKQCIRHGSSTRYAKRRQVGVRLPNDPICEAILQNLDEPLICTSVKSVSEDEWILDPVIIADIYEPQGPKLDWMVAEDEEQESRPTFAFKAA
uniref:Threonylcarbamoyl-AMP synthase n=1 Tax=Leersia perrieri TaxID=77586 RepID=A0A0D9XA48_9ORYZ